MMPTHTLCNIPTNTLSNTACQYAYSDISANSHSNTTHLIIHHSTLTHPHHNPATNIKTSAKYTQDFTMAVKYVRREIRTLTDEDREVNILTLKLT